MCIEVPGYVAFYSNFSIFRFLAKDGQDKQSTDGIQIASNLQEHCLTCRCASMLSSKIVCPTLTDQNLLVLELLAESVCEGNFPLFFYL